ncbi:hypothetical protein [Methylobacterium trifolii]|nr:hypothetical protein [Methylobacterium trifolii]
MHQTHMPQVDEATQRANAEWRAAGGPFSFVCGDTEADARRREATLRESGIIQPIDKVVRMPMRPEYPKPFLRHCLFEEWGPTKRNAIAAALASPGGAYPPGWYSQPPQEGPV